MIPSQSFHLTSPQFISLLNYLLMFSLMFSPGCLVINFLIFYDHIASPWIQVNCSKKSDRLKFAELDQLLIDHTACANSLGIILNIFDHVQLICTSDHRSRSYMFKVVLVSDLITSQLGYFILLLIGITEEILT